MKVSTVIDDFSVSKKMFVVIIHDCVYILMDVLTNGKSTNCFHVVCQGEQALFVLDTHTHPATYCMSVCIIQVHLRV